MIQLTGDARAGMVKVRNAAKQMANTHLRKCYLVGATAREAMGMERKGEGYGEGYQNRPKEERTMWRMGFRDATDVIEGRNK